MPVDISLDVSEIQKVADEALLDTVVELIEAITEAFDHDIYFWPNRTRRSNGEVVTSPRNVVDTGTLRDSWQLVHISGSELGIEWEAPYAEKVFEGDGNSRPARNVPMDTILQFDIVKVFESHLAKGL